ncbi:UBX domain-containing protein 6-like [Styela clava]
MKKFFQKVKLETKFRSAGEGHKLTDESGHGVQESSRSTQPVPVRANPMSESQANAAIAAIERNEKCKQTTSTSSSKIIKRLAKEAARASEDNKVPKSEPLNADAAEDFVPEQYSVEGVKFISALSGEIMQEKELNAHYKESFLLKLGSDEAIDASCSMIRTLNKDKSKIEIAVKTISKYIDNIIANPDEEKYRKIRKENKAFSERVAPLDGTEEFLNAVGFKLTMVSSDEKEELYFVLPNDINIENLKYAKDCLLASQPLITKLHRDMKIFQPSDRSLTFNLPNSFYNLTLEEVRREQGLKTEEIELSKQLRTKQMREKSRQTRKYIYALIRIRFPEGYILQGTFAVNEKFAEVRAFISENINVDWAPYTLKTSTGQTIDQDHETLSALQLIPSVILNLSWIAEVQAQLNEQGVTLSLKDEVLQKQEELN